MGWFKTQQGRLVHGDGGLAAVYRDRGYKPVTDKQAARQFKTAQDRAAREAVKSKAADRRDRAAETKKAAQARRERAKALAGDLGLATSSTHRTPSKAEQAAVDKAVTDETPRKG